MRMLYVAMKYDYGIPEQGYSLEHNTFYEPLQHLGHELIYFDFMGLLRELGRESMNRRLREIVASERPELLFCVLFGEEIDREAVRDISERTDTVTVCWFSDDH